jgi:hypothetical protein
MAQYIKIDDDGDKFYYKDKEMASSIGRTAPPLNGRMAAKSGTSMANASPNPSTKSSEKVKYSCPFISIPCINRYRESLIRFRCI